MVLGDGCFDPIHIGHVLYFAEAAAFGELIVRVAPDADILAKGRAPFQSQADRVRTVSALRMVHRVCADETLEYAIRRLIPTYLAKGPDWRGRLSREVLQACADVGTVIFYTMTDERRSTERLL